MKSTYEARNFWKVNSSIKRWFLDWISSIIVASLSHSIPGNKSFEDDYEYHYYYGEQRA